MNPSQNRKSNCCSKSIPNARLRVGRRIAAARLRAGMSQRKLSDVVGVSQSAVAHIELRGLNDEGRLAELAAAVGCPVEWLTADASPLDAEAPASKGLAPTLSDEEFRARAARVLGRQAGASPEVTYNRIPHAGHYSNGGGHDVEQWTYAQPERLPVPEGVPANADYHCGSRSGGVQTWTYSRIAPQSPGTCPRCTLPAEGAK